MRVLAAAAAIFLALVAVVSVAAHAEPIRVKPGDGAVLVQRPSEVVFEMSQELARQPGANDIDVFDAGGAEVTSVAAVIDNANRARLSVPLPADLAPGTYTVRWKTLSSEDGDDVSGETTFTYDPAAVPSPGKEVLREDLAGARPDAGGTGAQPPALDAGSNTRGVTWILVVAVGVGMLVLGAGGTFLLVQRQP
jgi:copper transport protein